MPAAALQLPAEHRALLDAVVRHAAADARFCGVLAAGSVAAGGADAFSDLDLVLVHESAARDDVLATRHTFAERCGSLLAAFTGEHVGEPRLLICLYGPPLVHVDLKFIAPGDLADRVDEPVVLWARDGGVAEGLRAGTARFPPPDLQWIEDRFWVWVHYAATKLGRGELFEALDFLAFLRARVLGPLALAAAGAQPNGVRRIERAVPAFVAPLARTVALHDEAAVGAAIAAAAELYVGLRAPHAAGLALRADAEREALAYLVAVRAGAPPRGTA
jgi:hypothetical protein